MENEIIVFFGRMFPLARKAKKITLLSVLFLVVGCLKYDSANKPCRTDYDCADCEDCYLGGCKKIECEHGCRHDTCLECHTGVCCSEDGHFKGEKAQCDQGTNYKCTSASCGGDVQKQLWVQYCDGENHGCKGSIAFGDWKLETDCKAGDLCFESQSSKPICASCQHGCFDGDCRDCTPGSGSCCDGAGNYKPDSAICDQGKNYKCSGTGCGDDVQQQDWIQYCDGQTDYCVGRIILGSWERKTDCEDKALCTAEQNVLPVCEPCELGCTEGLCQLCVDGPCCDKQGQYKDVGEFCEQWNEFRCSSDQCGSQAQYRAVKRSCTGDTNLCLGDTSESSWVSFDDCADKHLICETDSISFARCVPCSEYSSCVNGSCQCYFENCSGACCSDAEVCRWTGTCGADEARISASNPQSYNNFGRSVSISGNVAIVGAPSQDVGEEESKVDAGAVYIYHVEDDLWLEKKKLTAHDVQRDDRFGQSVSISGDVVIVGAPGEDGGDGDPIMNSGAAYIFKRELGQWVVRQKLTSSDHKENGMFGQSVSISGDVAIVGESQEAGSNRDAFDIDGAAYVFQLINDEWVQKAKLTGTDVQAGDNFGSSVSISGDIAIVGAHLEDGGEGDLYRDAGAAYIFQLENGQWTQKAKLTATHPIDDDNFGNAVSISGKTAVVGAYRDGGVFVFDLGAAYVFHQENGQWIEKQKLTASDDDEYDYFGSSVSISGQSVIVGSPSSDECGAAHLADCGSAYVFKLEEGKWKQKVKLTASDAQLSDEFGYSVSISENIVIVGAPYEDGSDGNPNQDAGAVYIY